MSSDRLTELQRQRALAQEQVAWFDREIARENAGRGTSPHVAPTPAAQTTAPAPSSESESPVIDREAEKILERYRHAGHPVKDEVKRGCLLYFFAAFALLGLGLTAFWFLRR